MGNTDKHWEEWGKKDPYFAVVTWDQFHRDRIDDARDEFFATGEEFVDSIVSKLDRASNASVRRNRALDFGCGVGRLTIPLAKRFQNVVGVDISDSMLDEARKNAAAHGVLNARFVKSDDTLSHADGAFDLIVSFIVLQHIPRARGYKIIDALLGRLAPGGSVMLHVSLRRTLSLPKRAVYFAKNKIPLAYYGFNALQRRPLATPPMQMNQYDLLKVVEAFDRHGIGDVSLALDRHPAAMTGMIFGSRA